MAKVVLIAAIPALMLKTEKNPGRLPLSVFYWTSAALMKSTRWNFMYQTAISGRTGEAEVSAQQHRATLEEQILRLQCLVSCLLEKNERLRQQLAAPREEE